MEQTHAQTSVDELIDKLTRHQSMLSQQKRQTEGSENRSDSSAAATDPYANTPPTESAPSDGRPDAAEVFRLKKELELANERMAQMDLQLTQSNLAQHTMEQAIGSPFPAAQHLAATIPGQGMMPGAPSMHAASLSRASTPFQRGGQFTMPSMPQQQS